MRQRRYVLGQPCPVPGHDHLLVMGETARPNGAHVTCKIKETQRRAAWLSRTGWRQERLRPEREEAWPAALPGPDPRWDAARACALAVAEDGGLWAACVVAPARYADRAAALAEAEDALRDVRGARARGGRDD